MGSQDLQKLVRTHHRNMAEKCKEAIEDWKHLIGVFEKQLESSTQLFEKYGDAAFKRFMDSDAANLAFYRKMLDVDMKLLDAYEADL